MSEKKRKLPAAMEKQKWVKGQPSPNPQGGRTHSPLTRALRKLTLEEFRAAIELVMTGSLADLKALAQNPKSTALQVGIATAFLNAIKHGDYAVIERIAERIIGKIPDEININSNNNNQNTHVVLDRALLKVAIKELEDEY